MPAQILEFDIKEKLRIMLRAQIYFGGDGDSSNEYIAHSLYYLFGIGYGYEK